MSDNAGLLPHLTPRLTYEESCRLLLQMGWLEGTDVPPMPTRMPAYNDPEPLGVSFFRTGVWDDEWPTLTLPRTFIGRSEVSHISFRNTDFSESCFCWNDFIDVDLTDARLCHCDLRVSLLRNVRFTGADLAGADLRLSEFTECDFTVTKMQGVKLTREQGQTLVLTDEQQGEVDWQSEDGEEPGGG